MEKFFLVLLCMIMVLMTSIKAPNTGIEPPNKQNGLCDEDFAIDIEISGPSDVFDTSRRGAINGRYEKQRFTREMLPVYLNEHGSYPFS